MDSQTDRQTSMYLYCSTLVFVDCVADLFVDGVVHCLALVLVDSVALGVVLGAASVLVLRHSKNINSCPPFWIRTSHFELLTRHSLLKTRHFGFQPAKLKLNPTF